MDCPVVALVGTVAVVGPVELAERDTTYRYIVIRDQGGQLLDFTMVRAVPKLSKLIERGTAGMFVFWETNTQCRLWWVDLADGRKGIDFAFLRGLTR